MSANALGCIENISKFPQTRVGLVEVPPIMCIEYLPEEKLFFLSSNSSTYVIGVGEFGALGHLYWGPRLVQQDLRYLFPDRDRAFSANPAGAPKGFSLDTFPQEFPAFGNSDFRSPAVEITSEANGSRIVDFRYKDHLILRGMPPLAGLPSTHAANEDAETLSVRLFDETLGLQAELSYTVFLKHSILCKSVRLSNCGRDRITIRRALSASVDFPASIGTYSFLHLSGAWLRERELYCEKLRPGIQSIESRRGASSAHQNPFFALCACGDNEEHGNVYAFNLVYSGNFVGLVEVDCDGAPRAQIGLNPFDFSWQLDPGDCFQTPEAILCFSPLGLGGMSRTFHAFYREHLGKGMWHRKPRPIVLNNWEATRFDITEQRLTTMASAGADLGMELLVLDDGWFGKRNDAKSSLGDWVVNPSKFPDGLGSVVRKINELGMGFGLWFEPEMISEDSDLYRAHPDWCLHVPGRPRSTGRFQLVLDFSRKEVREAIHDQISKILREIPIIYLKWDMNRNLTEVGSPALPKERQMESAHRYMLGLYEILERLTDEFPDLLIEGCSGGGGRFDPGMLHYMPQIWTSDNTDAICRLRVQYGTSLVYPLNVISAHVSVVPNHQVGRLTSIRTRGHVAFTGAFGYELDPTVLSEEDRAAVREQTADFKKFIPLLTQGTLFRLRSPFKGNEAAWLVVASDLREAILTYVQILEQPNPGWGFLKLKGLDPMGVYHIHPEGKTYRGDILMNAGLPIPVTKADYTSHQWHLTLL